MILVPKQKYLNLIHLETERPIAMEEKVKSIREEEINESPVVEHTSLRLQQTKSRVEDTLPTLKPEVKHPSNEMKGGKQLSIKRKLYKGPPGFMSVKRKWLKY